VNTLRYTLSSSKQGSIRDVDVCFSVSSFSLVKSKVALQEVKTPSEAVRLRFSVEATGSTGLQARAAYSAAHS
jgi:hypothetical protein